MPKKDKKIYFKNQAIHDPFGFEATFQNNLWNLSSMPIHIPNLRGQPFFPNQFIFLS
jgi:hypothetical protein